MKVVITDRSFDDIDLERAILERAGCTVVDPRSKDPAVLAAAVADADAVITQFAPINADVIAAMGRAKAIVRYGIGYDNVDCEAAKARGIPVCNIPDYCIDEVADHTLAVIHALGFPPFRGGLLAWADTLGAAEIVRRLAALSGLGVRMRPTPRLESLARDGGPFTA